MKPRGFLCQWRPCFVRMDFFLQNVALLRGMKYTFGGVAGVSAAVTAHAVRALHPLGVPVLRQLLLHDVRRVHLQFSLPPLPRKWER